MFITLETSSRGFIHCSDIGFKLRQAICSGTVKYLGPQLGAHIGQFQLIVSILKKAVAGCLPPDQTPGSAKARILRELSEDATSLISKRYQILKFVFPPSTTPPKYQCLLTTGGDQLVFGVLSSGPWKAFR